MKILFQYLAKYKGYLVMTLFLAFIAQIFSMMDPYIMRLIIDDYASKVKELSRDEFLRGVFLLGMGIIGVAMVSRIAKAFQDYFLNLITQKLSTDIYNDGLKHALSLPYAVFEDQRSGETLGILQKVRTDVQRLISSMINILFTSLVGIVAVTIYSFSVYWLIGPIFLTVIPLLAIVSSFLTKKIKKTQKSIVAETTSLAGTTTESLRNIELVKSTGLTDQEINRLEQTTNKILLLEIKKVKYIRSLGFVQGTLINFLRTSIIVMMMYLIYLGNISVGEFFSLFMYSFFIFNPLTELGNVLNIYSESVISLDNFKHLMAQSPEAIPANAPKLNHLDQIEFKNVKYFHQEKDKPAVEKIDFTVNKGGRIAFVGPSGAGKSTMVKLLTGLYLPTEGEVLYNGFSSTAINRNDVRALIGIVNQETHLFAGTIKENLLFVKPDATDDQLIDALHKAAAGPLLQRAEKGIDTPIGEGGIKISGGEKQRIAIARALLRKPNLLIFDEATSALDSITEEEINRTIKNLEGNQDRITVMIAHRLSTIMYSDIIYVLEEGHIVEKGNHQQLLDLKGLYYAMWRQQAGLGTKILEQINYS